MKILLTSAGLETEELQDYFVKMLDKEMNSVRALFIPTAAVDAGAIAVLPKCMNDLLKCGISESNIKVYDMHNGMELKELSQYDAVYICGGDTRYLLQRMNETGFAGSLKEYILAGGAVLGVSAGSLIFADNIPDNLGLIPVKLEVHCAEGEQPCKKAYPLKDPLRLTNTCALAIRKLPDGMELIGT